MEHQVQDKAFDFIEQNREKLLAFWEELVNMESGSRDKENVDLAAERVAAELESFGVETEILSFEKAGNSVAGILGKDRPGTPVVLMGHYDTVFPAGTVEKRPFRIEDGKAYGPGVLDMKGGVALLIFAAKALEAAGYADRPIRFVLAGDEETGHCNSSMAKVFEERSRGCVAAFNCETGDPNNKIVVGRKGVVQCEMAVKGIAVHAGREPQKGRSAILELSHKIIDIHRFTDFERGLTFNVGTVKGGVVPNAVPDNASAGIDVRCVNVDQISEAKEKLQAAAAKKYVPDTTTTLTFSSAFFPMEQTPENERLFRYVADVYRENGLPEPSMEFSGGGSDSAFSVLAGVPTVDQMGVKGEWNHSDREYAIVESIFERAKVLAACILNIHRFES
ncbi:MAG: M20 family metallopeptidase [Synergistaceae bacterium]|nr:M20 family metallopeptidase [Synergistaceae bacterium]